ncbi:MAG TPA: B12-binding domain-containing radical SAM protein, partial [Candidatus Brocadiaceae bacterium]
MGKHILLVSSWTNDKKVLGYYLSPPMGLYRIQHWLKDKHDVDVLDPNIEEPVSYLEKCGKYDVIGFSPTKDNLHNDVALMRYAKKLHPAATLVAGGVEATCNYQQLLDMDVIDYILMGEGEKALEYFLDGKVHLKLSPSIITKDYSFSTVLTQQELVRATSLDLSKLPIKEYWQRNATVTGGDILSTNCINLYITNYCPQGCKFCSTTRFIRQAVPAGTSVTALPPRELVNIIKRIMMQVPETKTIYFHDDNACHNRQNTIEWCNLAIKEGIKVTYVASSRITDFDEEVLDVMKRAGFRKLSCGIESYSDSLLRKIRKGQLTRNIDNFLNITSAVNLPVHVNLILCMPEAEIDDVKRTAEFCLRILEDKRNTVTVEPFIKAYAGSWYYDHWDIIEYKCNTVPSINGTKSDIVRIPVRFLPRDPKVRKLLEQIDNTVENDEFFVEKRKKGFLMAQLSEKICKMVLELI